MSRPVPRALLGVPLAVAGRFAALPATAVRGALPLVTLAQNALALLDAAASLLHRANALLDRLDPLLDRIDGLLDTTDRAMRQAAPFVDELATSVTRDHARAFAVGLDMLPELESMALPAMRNLVALIPELDLVLERLDSIFDIIEGMPGAQRFKRRAAAAHDPR